MTQRLFGMSLTLSLVLSGCIGDSIESVSEDIPIRTASDHAEPEPVTLDDAAASGSRVRTFENLTLRIPDGWEEMELSDFQRGVINAKYRMPEHGSDLTLTVSFASGGIDANFHRWRGQITGGEEDTDELDATGRTVRLIELTGRFSGGFGRDPQDDWQLTGVGIPNEPQDMYLKLTGPIDQARNASDDVRALARSVRAAR